MTLRPGSPHEIGREDSTLAPVTPDPGSELQRQIGDFLLHTPRTDTPPLPQPPSRLFNIARRLGAWLQPDRKPADTSTVTSPLAETLQTAPYTFQLEPTEQLNMAPYLGRAGVDLSEKTASRET